MSVRKRALCFSWGSYDHPGKENSDMVWCWTTKHFQIIWLKQQDLNDLSEIIDVLAKENERLELICKNRGINV